LTGERERLAGERERLAGERERLAGERERLAGERERRGEDLRGGERDLPRRGEGDLEAGALRQRLGGRSVVRGEANRVRTRTAGKVHECAWKMLVLSTFHGGGSCGHCGHSCPCPCRPSCSCPCPCRTLPFHRPRPRPHRVLPCKSERQRDQGQQERRCYGPDSTGKGRHLLNSTRTRFPKRSLPSLSLTASRCDWNRPRGHHQKARRRTQRCGGGVDTRLVVGIKIELVSQ
jgi:hypothetical protein